MGSLCYDPIKKTKSCPHCDGAERAAFLFFIYVSAVGRSAGQKASEGMFSLAQTLFSILPRLRFGKRSPKAAARRGETLSVTASPATSPERERLWQGRKVYRLSADFFLPLTNEDETCPFCQGLHLRGSCRRRRLRGFVLKATLSVTASPCHLSRKGEALAGA